MKCAMMCSCSVPLHRFYWRWIATLWTLHAIETCWNQQCWYAALAFRISKAAINAIEST